MTKKSLCSPATAARVCKYLVDLAGGEGRAVFLPTQKKLAPTLGLCEMHCSRVFKQLRSDGRLVMNDDRSYCVYLTADVSRVREAAKKLRQRGSVFGLQQSVNTLLEIVNTLQSEIRDLRSDLARVRSAPLSSPALSSLSAPAAPAARSAPSAPAARSAAPAGSLGDEVQAAEIQTLRERWLNAFDATERVKDSKASSEVIKQAEATESRLFNDYLQAKDKAKLS